MSLPLKAALLPTKEPSLHFALNDLYGTSKRGLSLEGSFILRRAHSASAASQLVERRVSPDARGGTIYDWVRVKVGDVPRGGAYQRRRDVECRITRPRRPECRVPAEPRAARLTANASCRSAHEMPRTGTCFTGVRVHRIAGKNTGTCENCYNQLCLISLASAQIKISRVSTEKPAMS